MIEQAHFILYVSDQARAERFYSAVLQLSPSLSVPGMTEFQLRDRAVLGLMPEHGIRRLLPQLPSDLERLAPRAELYLRVDDPAAYHARALTAGAKELDPLLARSWGDRASYCADLDGYVIAFAQRDPREDPARKTAG